MNIGAILMEKQDYNMAYVCFTEAEDYMTTLIREHSLDDKIDE